jgi:hypothetical protein
MYWLMSLDALVRIVLAMALLFVAVPALAWPRRAGTTFLERFFWNFGVGLTLLTLVGQILSLVHLFSVVTLLLVCGVVILVARSVDRGHAPGAVARKSLENSFLASLNILDRRINVRRRIRRKVRRTISAIREKLEPRETRLQLAGWVALGVIAAAFRLYRPLSTANLGFSDTYVHLYFLKLLEGGQQVDPSFGPYPRGMHFLLMAIHQLTNVDDILLMNLFGSVVGVLITFAVADTARRLSGSLVAGLVAGFLFATTVGGASQAFVLGPSSLLLDAFQRQTMTLPQELAIALLFPALTFLLDYLRRGDRWYLIGFAGCTAAIAAVHSGVVIPLVFMAGLAVVAVAVTRSLHSGAIRGLAVASVVAVIVGSSWALAFIAYPYFGGQSESTGGFSFGTVVTFFTPFMNAVVPTEVGGVTSEQRGIATPVTAFVIAGIILSIGLVVSSFAGRREHRASRLWIGLVALFFLSVHFAGNLGIPQLLDPSRNSQWMMMSLLIVSGVSLAGAGSMARSVPGRLRITTTHVAVVVALLLMVWAVRVPLLNDSRMREQLVNSSGYGASTLAVLMIQKSFQPYTWTLVSYGQEFPMVLRRGFHVPAADFLDRYDPAVDVVPIPTPHVFIIVEKNPHPFEIGNWARRFSRSDLQERLQTWVYLYQSTHRNLRVFLEDEHVRVYQIDRTPEEIARISKRQ